MPIGFLPRVVVRACRTAPRLARSAGRPTRPCCATGSADGGARTLMAFRPPASEAGASSGSATSALASRRPVLRATARRSLRGRARAGPLASCRLEPRLATDVELHDLGRAQHLLGAGCDPYEVEMHL